MKLPTTITILGDEIKIIETKLSNGKKGEWDERQGIIRIEKSLPHAGKVVILIHEALHVTETLLLQSKVIKKRISHEFIEAASFGLCAILAGADCLVSLKETDLFDLVK